MRKEKLTSFIKKFEIANNPLSLLEFKEVFEAVKREFPDLLSSSNWPRDEKKLADELLLSIFWKELSLFENYILRWEKGLWVPSEEDLRELKKYQGNFGEVVSFFDSLIEKGDSSENLEKEKEIAKENKQKLDKLLKNDEYRQKAEELLKKHGNSPTSPQNNPPVDKSDVKKMTGLLSRVNELEEKLKQTPNSESDKQELERIKKEVEDLKNKQKDKPQQEDKKNNFPTGLVVGGGIVIAVLLLAIIFLVRKNSK